MVRRLVAFTFLTTAIAAALSGQYTVPPMGSSPLHVATARGITEIVELLLQNGADPNQRDILGRAPLHYAGRFLDIAELLVAAGADVNVRDRFDETPLYRSVANQAMVRFLLESGARVGVRNHVGDTALDRALRLRLLPRTVDTIRLLIQAQGGAGDSPPVGDAQ